MEAIKAKIIGTHPLLMHSDRLANPLSQEAKAHKELTAKRKKTEEDHEAIARSEFAASAYFDQDIGFFLPGQNFDASFIAGAKLQKLGTHWKRGALVLESRVKLIHDGPSTLEDLWRSKVNVDCRGVKVGAAKIMRYRPVFMSWSAELTVMLNTEVLSAGEARKVIGDAGALIGVGDYRPRFGRFEVQYG